MTEGASLRHRLTSALHAAETAERASRSSPAKKRNYLDLPLAMAGIS